MQSGNGSTSGGDVIIAGGAAPSPAVATENGATDGSEHNTAHQDAPSANKTVVSNVETEYTEICKNNAWNAMYLHIRSKCNAYDYTSNESKKPQNAILNRYRDVAPYDHTRIKLEKGPSDYINANIVKMESANRHYILTQGPLAHTAGHFWLMVWEQNTKGVIMLNKVMEKNQNKCHQYWPLENQRNRVMRFPDVGIKVEYVGETESSDYVMRTLKVTNEETKECRDVLHFHYTTWPDFGVPESPEAFLRFLADCRVSGCLDAEVGPAIVHCSAGIGRSGTFCLVDTCLILIEKNGLNSINVKEILLEMRKFRMGLIQTADQLRFSYEVIIEGAKRLPLESLSNMNLQNGIVTHNNHNDASYDGNESDEEEEDDEPPPLPPPRGDSLNARINANVEAPAKEIPEAPVSANTSFDKPLPREPPIPGESAGYNNKHDVPISEIVSRVDKSDESEPLLLLDNSPPSSPETTNNLRKRRQERLEKLDAQVRDMKRKQKQSEDWETFKRSLPKPISLSLIALIGGGILSAYLYYRG